MRSVLVVVEVGWVAAAAVRRPVGQFGRRGDDGVLGQGPGKLAGRSGVVDWERRHGRRLVDNPDH
jgi:hypothetical protein